MAELQPEYNPIIAKKKNRKYLSLTETLKYKHFLHKYVEVIMVNNDEHQGWMGHLDPLTGDMILHSSYGRSFLMGDSIASVDIWGSDRMNNLFDSFKKMRIEVRKNEDGSLDVDRSVSIFPPYRPEDILGENSFIVESARKMMSRLLPSTEEKITEAMNDTLK